MTKVHHCRRMMPPLLLILCLCLLVAVGAFHPARSRTIPSTAFFHRPRRHVVLEGSSGADVETEDATAADGKTGKKGMTMLKFVGSSSYSTESVPRPEGTTFAEFFAVNEHRDVLMIGTNNIVEPIDDSEVTPELIDRWSREAERMGAAEPEAGDSLLRVTTAGIQFPGLKVLSVATIGAKLLRPSGTAEDASDHPEPEYEFTLVRDFIRAEGPRPLIWVFNKLTGSKDGKETEQTTHSLTRTRVRPVEGEANSYVFTSNSYLEVDVQFPSFLLRILPVSKEKAEEQGSASIQKAIEKDTGPALENFREKYLQWLES